MNSVKKSTVFLPEVVSASGHDQLFAVGDAIRVLQRSPVGHYRVPIYLRGKSGSVEAVIEPTGIDNEEEGFGRNSGVRRHYYRIAIPMDQVWSEYVGRPQDGLRIEVYETWLEKV